ncbi:MAG TPA: toll/interleukin-1 receptor domain-containing protein [Longimicrobium sp.]|nr:toll/interleukin-1 receptor domain-containing protein [Longimicrobium sp.]
MNVYISYSHSDSELAARLGEGLRRSGLEVRNAHSVLPGEAWMETVERFLREANAMVVLVTPQSVDSSSLHHDVGYALGHTAFKGRVVPVLAGTAAEVDELLHQMPWILKSFNPVQLKSPEMVETAVRKVADTLIRAA